VGNKLTTILLDTHVILWWSAERSRLSPTAQRAIADSDELAVSAISWWELARFARRQRIAVPIPLPAWLERLALQVNTVGITPAIALAAANLPDTFPGDPADRLIYATAIERGYLLVTKDQRLRAHRHRHKVTVW
jgi:PIN domain nuclease of toxin-antitoxin system